MRRVAQKKKCLQHRALIVAWLRVNYCLRESGSIAKCEVFFHYTELCRANKMQPSSAAAFGKILKMAFPTVKCNRVGPRGASKHHYRGLVLREGYQLSLANVEPLSEAAITQLMKEEADADAAARSRARSGGGRSRDDDDDGDGDEEDDDEDDDDGDHKQKLTRNLMTPKSESSTNSPSPRQPLSSSSSSSPHPSSPTARSAAASNAHGYPPPQASLHPSHPPFSTPYGYAPMPQTATYVLPPPQQPPYHHPHQPLHQDNGGHATATKESFSWISPDMDAYAAKRSLTHALLPPPQAQLQSALQSTAAPTGVGLLGNSAAMREWTEKRDLVEFCERNFQALYDSVQRSLHECGSTGEARDQVLTSIADAWKNLRQYTNHMNLFPEPPPVTAGVQPPPPPPPQIEQQRPTATMVDSAPASHGSPPASAHGQPLSHFAMLSAPLPLPLPPSYYTRVGTPPPLPNSFSNGGGSGSSSLSLSWLANSLAMSMSANGNHHQRVPMHPSIRDGVYSHMPAGADGSSGSDRGSLEFRSFEWKGVYE